MSRRTIEIALVVVGLALCTLAYLGKKNVQGWHSGFEFSPTTSQIVIGLIGLSLVWILVRTLQDKAVGRRTVFLYVGIAIALPLFMSIDQDIVISENTRHVYESLGELPPGSKVLVSFDYDPASSPELQPMAEAFLAECFRRDLKVIMVALWAPGAIQANIALDTVRARLGLDTTELVYGEDYCNLGYQAGREFVIQRMGTSFEAMFGTDVRGTPYRQIPLVRNVRNFSDINYAFNISAGFPGTVEWVQVAVSRFGLKLGAGNTAVQAPQVYPYLRAGQLQGLLAGINGAAEFEKLIGLKAVATTYMLAQTFAHLIVIAFIIIGNIAYFRGERETKLRGRTQ
ncbi:MAG: hypothetical protein AB1772_03190 [Candidatus Zixiibacteriota bacterium]